MGFPSDVKTSDGIFDGWTPVLARECDGGFTFSCNTTAAMSWSSHRAICGDLGDPRTGALTEARGSFPPMSTSIDVVINGQPRTLAAGTTVIGLITELGLAGRPVAVERNREIVPRAVHASTVLAEGDRVELVTFVGGGS